MTQFIVNQEKKLEAYTALKALLMTEVETYKEADTKAMSLLNLAEKVCYLMSKRAQTRDEEERSMLNSISILVEKQLASQMQEYAVSNYYARAAMHEVVLKYRFNAISVHVHVKEEEEA